MRTANNIFYEVPNGSQLHIHFMKKLTFIKNIKDSHIPMTKLIIFINYFL